MFVLIRKLVCFALTFVLLFTGLRQTNADVITVYKLDETGVSVSIPSNFIVFTRDMDEKDPNLARYGLTKESLATEMATKQRFLEAWDTDVNFEIYIRVSSSSSEDFSTLSDASLLAIAASVADNYKSSSFSLLKSDIYRGDQSPFIGLHAILRNEGLTRGFLQYATVVAKKVISVMMFVNSGQVAPENQAIIESIADSMTFDPQPLAARAPTIMSYELTDTGISISLPTQYTVFTREIEENDPNLAASGFTKETLLSEMIARNFSLLAWNAEGNVEVRITVSSGFFTDYKSISDVSLANLASLYFGEMKARGFSIINSEIFPANQATFFGLQASIQAENLTLAILQYHTVAAGKAINVMMRIDSGKVTSEYETEMRNLVNSMTFGTQKRSSQNDFLVPGPYEYRDELSKTVFTVPANWSKANLVQHGNASGMFVAANANNKISITHISGDNTGNSGEVSLFEIGAIMRKFEAEGFTLSETDAVSYGGYNYQRAIMLSKAKTSNSANVDQITGLFIKVNGRLHSFVFMGPIDDPLYADFEQLMESVQFLSN